VKLRIVGRSARTVTWSAIVVVALAAVAATALLSPRTGSPPQTPGPTPAPGGAIVGIRQIAASPLFQGRPGVEIEVRSDRAFPVRDEITVLRIGAREFVLSRYPESGDTHTLIFTLSVDEFAATTAGDAVVVQYGRGEQPDRWDLGRLDKTVR
jgi:hypothetical protein